MRLSLDFAHFVQVAAFDLVAAAVQPAGHVRKDKGHAAATRWIATKILCAVCSEEALGLKQNTDSSCHILGCVRLNHRKEPALVLGRDRKAERRIGPELGADVCVG